MTGPDAEVDRSAVWIVVLTWNGRADTLRLLDSLTGEPATVLVVDNASTDGTAAAVAAAHPEVELLPLPVNGGYVGGNNAGIDHALARGARVVGVLNNDTVVCPGLVTALLAALDEHTVVSPDIRYLADPGTSWYRGAVLDRRADWPRHLEPAEQPTGPAPFGTDWLTGCCFFATARTWRRVGLFEPRLFLYFEDSDWSARAVRAGLSLTVVPAARLLHAVSASTAASPELSLVGRYLFVRNGCWFSRRHLGVAGLARFVRGQVLRPLVRAAVRREDPDGALMAGCGAVAALLKRWGAPSPRVRGLAARLQRRRVAGTAHG